MSGEDWTANDLRSLFDELDGEHIALCATAARAAWLGGVRVFEVGFMPGDGTHYGLLFTVLGTGTPIISAPGGGTGGHGMYTVSGCPFDSTYALVTYLQQGRSTVMGFTEFMHPSRVEQAFPGIGYASTLAIAYLLNEITQGAPGWRQHLIDQAEESEAAMRAAPTE